MSEHQPQQPNGEQGVNSYGTDDPVEQARIEQARADAHAERQRNREKLERYVELGLNPEDASALIEHEDMLRQQREAAGETDEQDKRAGPRIYVRSLIDHNEGHDIGEWIDANQDVEALQADIQHILDRSLYTHWTGIPAEEWAIHDYEGFGGVYLGEHESLDVVSQLAKGIAEHGTPFAIWADVRAQLADGQQLLEDLDRFTAAYIGEFDSRAAFGEQVVSDHDVREVLLRHLPRWLVNYISIDHAGIAHELEVDGEVIFADREGGGVWAFNGRV